MKLVAAVAVLLASAAVAGCGSSASPPSQADAVKGYCESVKTFQTTVKHLQALDPATASMDDYAAATAEVGTAWDDLQDAAKALGEADRDALQRAIANLESAVDESSKTVPLDQAGPEAKQALNEINDVTTGISDGITCKVG